MDVKEKLVELLESVPHPQRLYPDVYVDMLIKNGVTIQEWFPVDEVLPTEDDANEDGHVMVMSKDMGCVIAYWQDVERFKEYVSHWTHMPKFVMGDK